MSILGDPKGWPPDFNGYVFLGRVLKALPPDIMWAAFNSGKLELRAWTTGAAKFELVRTKTFHDSDRERALSTYQYETSGPQPYWLYVKRRSLIVFSLNNERGSVSNPAIPRSLYWRPDLEHFPHDGAVEAPANGVVETPAKTRGRKSNPRWEEVKTKFFGLMDYHGDFSTDDPEWNVQARLEEALKNFCQSKWEWNVGDSSLRERLPFWLNEWRARKEEIKS